MDLRQRKVAVDDPHLAGVLLTGPLQGGQDRGAERALEVRELDDRHRRFGRSAGGKAVGVDRNPKRFEPVIDRKPPLQRVQKLGFGALLRLLLEKRPDLVRDLRQRIGNAFPILQVESLHLLRLHRGRRRAGRRQQPVGGRPGAAGLQVEQAPVHQVAEKGPQNLIMVPVGLRFAAQALQLGFLQRERRRRQQLVAVYRPVVYGRHHAPVRPRVQGAGKQERRQQQPDRSARRRPRHGAGRHRTDLSRRALAITDTDDRLIATAAIAGESSAPVTGYRTPAATGTPMPL